MLRLIDICQEPITRSLQLVTEVPVGISIRDKFKTKNRSVCEKAVTGIWGSCRLLVMGSCICQIKVSADQYHMTTSRGQVWCLFVCFSLFYLLRYVYIFYYLCVSL